MTSKGTFVQLVTDLGSVPETTLLDRLRAAARLPLSARARLSVQLRDPELPVRELFRLGGELRALTRELGVGLVINDRLDLALLLGAEGVHLGRASVTVAAARSLLGQSCFVSMSAHCVADVVAAAEAGANAALLSPVFASPGKGAGIGVAALGEARAALAAAGLSLRLFALGGVTAENAADVVAAGADGVAAIRADLTEVLGRG